MPALPLQIQTFSIFCKIYDNSFQKEETFFFWHTFRIGIVASYNRNGLVKARRGKRAGLYFWSPANKTQLPCRRLTTARLLFNIQVSGEC
jgi:hypothetical protein